jgi:hypothetical protein
VSAVHSSHDVGGPCECPEVIPSWAQIRRGRRVKWSGPEIFLDVFYSSRQYIGSERDSGMSPGFVEMRLHCLYKDKLGLDGNRPLFRHFAVSGE